MNGEEMRRAVLVKLVEASDYHSALWLRAVAAERPPELDDMTHLAAYGDIVHNLLRIAARARHAPDAMTWPEGVDEAERAMEAASSALKRLPRHLRNDAQGYCEN